MKTIIRYSLATLAFLFVWAVFPNRWLLGKGAYGTLVNINAGMTPSFGVDALGRLAVTWQYQRKGAQQ